MTSTTKPAKPPKRAKPPGPEPDRLKLTGNWQNAVKTALAKKRPPDGWPKAPKDK